MIVQSHASLSHGASGALSVKRNTGPAGGVNKSESLRGSERVRNGGQQEGDSGRSQREASRVPVVMSL